MAIRYFEEKIIDKRLKRMIEIAEELDVSLDLVVAKVGRVDQKIFLAVSDSPSSLPR